MMIEAAAIFLAVYILAIGVAFWRWGLLYGVLVLGGSSWLLSKYIAMAIMVFVMVFAAIKMKGMLNGIKVTA
jgi:hypothetical protein